MNIGLDIDGVLAEAHGPVLDYLNSSFHKSYKLEDVGNWDAIQTLYGLTREHLTLVLDGAWANWREVPLVDSEAPYWVKKWRGQGHKIHIITHRTFQTVPSVMRWLADRDIKYDAFVVESGGNKCRFPIDVLVDDNPKLVEWVSQTQPNVCPLALLYDQPWNKSVALTHPLLSRVSSFEEVDSVAVSAPLLSS